MKGKVIIVSTLLVFSSLAYAKNQSRDKLKMDNQSKDVFKMDAKFQGLAHKDPANEKGITHGILFKDGACRGG